MLILSSGSYNQHFSKLNQLLLGIASLFISRIKIWEYSVNQICVDNNIILCFVLRGV